MVDIVDLALQLGQYRALSEISRDSHSHGILLLLGSTKTARAKSLAMLSMRNDYSTGNKQQKKLLEIFS